MIERVGVIGLGKMGQPIVTHLRRRGYAVLAHDVDRQAVAAAEALGAKSCPNPREVAAHSELVIVVVGFDSEVLDVLRGPDGVLAGAADRATIAIASTVSPQLMQDLAHTIGTLKRDIALLDTPLCRGEPAALEGKLLMMVGGDPDVLERCRPAFATFAADIHWLGRHGAGQVGKMINNLLLWACTSANHEGFKLATALGVDGERLRAALLQSSGSNWALETSPQTRPMPWAEKDMAIVMQEADAAHLSLPLCGVVREVIKGVKHELGMATPVPRK
jgi:3-hydroxyisobutyrate dehydrogenase-like beta-hydroxyacid dehydrogenase